MPSAVASFLKFFKEVKGKEISFILETTHHRRCGGDNSSSSHQQIFAIAFLKNLAIFAKQYFPFRRLFQTRFLFHRNAFLSLLQTGIDLFSTFFSCVYQQESFLLIKKLPLFSLLRDCRVKLEEYSAHVQKLFHKKLVSFRQHHSASNEVQQIATFRPATKTLSVLSFLLRSQMMTRWCHIFIAMQQIEYTPRI